PALVAEGIVSAFRNYLREVQSTAPDPTRSAERRRLSTLLVELRKQHQDYEHASAGWSNEAPKTCKKPRKARAETLLKMHVLLARLGELERLSEIERLPFLRKIERIDEYLTDQERKAGVAAPLI